MMYEILNIKILITFGNGFVLSDVRERWLHP